MRNYTWCFASHNPEPLQHSNIQMTVVSFEVASCACTPESKVHAESRGGCCSRQSVIDIENRIVQLEEKFNKMPRNELQSEAIRHKVLGNLTSAQMISNLVSTERESAWLGLINAVRSSTGDIVKKSRLVLQVMEGNVSPQKMFITVEENDSTGPFNLHLIHRIVDSIAKSDLSLRPHLFAIFKSGQVPETILASMKTRPPGVVNPTHPHAAIG